MNVYKTIDKMPNLKFELIFLLRIILFENNNNNNNNKKKTNKKTVFGVSGKTNRPVPLQRLDRG